MFEKHSLKHNYGESLNPHNHLASLSKVEAYMQHTGRIRFSDSPGQPIVVDAKLDDFDLERAAGKGEQ